MVKEAEVLDVETHVGRTVREEESNLTLGTSRAIAPVHGVPRPICPELGADAVGCQSARFVGVCGTYQVSPLLEGILFRKDDSHNRSTAIHQGEKAYDIWSGAHVLSIPPVHLTLCQRTRLIEGNVRIKYLLMKVTRLAKNSLPWCSA